MPGSAVFTIISSVTKALVCASAGIEMRVARKKPAVAIEILNGASLMLLVLLLTQRNGNSGDRASNSRRVRVIQCRHSRDACPLVADRGRLGVRDGAIFRSKFNVICPVQSRA
jgi:hypothetical protein